MTRSRLCVLPLIALACGAVLGADDFIRAEPLHDAGLVKFWQLQLPLAPDQIVRDAYLVDDQLYFGTHDGYVYAVDAKTGILRWVQPVTRSGYHVRRPCHFAERTVFVTPIDIQFYDKRTGDGLTRKPIRFPSGTGPITDGTRLFVGGLDGRLYAFDGQTQYVEWRLITDGPIYSTPTIYNQEVIVGNDGGTVYACTRERKAFLWRALTHGPVQADLVVDEFGVYVASRDQSLYCFDLGFGQVRWRVRFAAPLYDAPFVTPSLVFQYAPTEGVAAVDTALMPEDGERVRWKLPAGRLTLALNGELVYILGNEVLLAVQQKDGAIASTVPAPRFTMGLPVLDMPTVYLAAPDGRIFCARPPNVPFLRQEDVAAALRPGGADGKESVTATQPTTRPAPESTDPLQTKRGGTPIGGKSKVSRGYKGGEDSE